MENNCNAQFGHIINLESASNIIISDRSARVQICLIHGTIQAISQPERSLKRGSIINDQYEKKNENIDDFTARGDFTILVSFPKIYV